VGENLLKDVAVATGLPQEMVSEELCRLISKAGLDPADLTLEDLRQVLAEYVQEVLMAAQQEFSQAAES
jgi:hypothetical protein